MLSVSGLICSLLLSGFASALPASLPQSYILNVIKPNLQAANATLPSPPSGQTLQLAVIGMGTQNYTCKGNSSAAPMSIGALATLYDASMLMESSLLLFDAVPALSTLYQPTFLEASPVYPEMLPIVGQQNFDAALDVTFYFNETAILSAKKVGDIKAPPGSISGQGGYGAVDWLFLEDNGKNITKGPFQSAYRVQTAGGNPPLTCEGQPELITVQYAAQYFLYGNGQQ